VVVEETFGHGQVMLWCAIKAKVSSLCGCGFQIECCLVPYCTHRDWTFESFIVSLDFCHII